MTNQVHDFFVTFRHIRILEVVVTIFLLSSMTSPLVAADKAPQKPQPAADKATQKPQPAADKATLKPQPAADAPPKLGSAGQPLKLDMTIFLDGRNVKGSKAEGYQKRWFKLCDQLKGYLENKHQTLGNGPFQTVTCVPTMGKIKAVYASQPATWMLRVSDNATKSGFEIFYMGTGTRKPRLEAAHVTVPNGKFMVGISKGNVVKDIVILLEDQLPMYSIFKMPKDLTDIVTKSPLLPDPIPKELMLYTLNFDREKQVWSAKTIGYAERNDEKADGGKQWELHLHRGVVKNGEIVFVHNAQGRGVIADSYKNRLSSMLGKLGILTLYEVLMSSLDSNLIGIRYGYPLLKATDVISKSSMLSMFLEIRGGIFRGLRLYYDSAPVVQNVTKEKNKETFGWKSVNAGWSFGIPLPKFASSAIQRFDVYPKIGMFNLTSKLEVPDASGAKQLVNFNLKNALNLGFESGIEHSTINFGLFRAWLAYNKSWSKLAKSETQFSSWNAGVDYYFDLFKMGKIKLKGLAFSSVSYITLGETLNKNAIDATDPKTDVVAIDGLSYRLIFAGLGVTMAW